MRRTNSKGQYIPDYLEVTPDEFNSSFNLHKWIGEKRHTEKVLLSGAKRLSYIGKRLTGYPQREVVPQNLDNKVRICCPNIQIVRKYIPALGRLVDLPVPCGHCMWCRHKSQNKLIFRLYQHARVNNNCIYVTLTYDEFHRTEDPVELRKDITNFLKRFRKRRHDKTISYYLVCERGDLFSRPHFHMLIFWNGPASKSDVFRDVVYSWVASVRNYTFSDLSDLLRLDSLFEPSPIGHVDVDFCESANGNDVSTAIMAYISKYVSDNTKHLIFRSWSNHLGFDILSVDYDLVQKMMYLRMIDYMPSDKVYSVAIPQYYKNILFTDSERACFFNDWLLSPEYEEMKSLTDGTNYKYRLAKDAYDRYVDRCNKAYQYRLKKKKRKYFRDTGKLLDD